MDSGARRAGTIFEAAARGILLALAVALLVAVSAGPARAEDPFTFGSPAFCTPKKPVRDFGLSKLPAMREVPESAKSLGYGAVSMYGGGSRVMPEPSPFGYGFSENNYDGVVRLDWTVTARLWTANKKGTVLREVEQKELFIGDLDAAHQPQIEVNPPSGRRGFYRFDMQIMDRSGKTIGSFGAYFKVVRPSWRPRLALNRNILRPGQRMLMRVENYGSETIIYGESFRVQRFEDGTWVPAEDLTPKLWLLWLGGSGPGGTGRCSALSLRSDTPPGHYRIVKMVKGRPGGGSARLAAGFDVIESGAEIEY